MKVAHINGVYCVMSTGRLIHALVADGQNNGQESRVYYSECHSDAPEAVRYISDSERNVHALLSRLSGLQGYWSSFATKRLCRMLDEFSPDIVHLHVVHGNCLRLSALFNWLHRTGVPVVITLHDCWWFTGRCVHPTRYQCNKYTDGCHGCPANNDICPSWFFDRASRMLKNKKKWLDSCSSVRVIAVSDWIAAQAQKSFLKQYSIQRIYNWVDTDIFRPVDTAEIRGRLRLDGKRVVLGVASRWSAEKGLNDFRFFAKELPRDYQVILVGQIEAPLSFPDNLLHLPQTNSPQELAQLYSMAEVFVNASRMETFGLTTAEAMACGTPAAVYNTTACPELIGKGTGRTVELSKGASGLLEAVIALANSDASRCRAWVVVNFSRQRGCAQYQAVYRSMLGGE